MQLSEAEQKSNRLHLLSVDARRAWEYLNSLHTNRSLFRELPEVHSALMTAAIIVYSRSFTKNYHSLGQAPAKLEVCDLPFFTEEGMKNFHTKVIEARSSMIAHSDWSVRNTSVVQKDIIESSNTSGILRKSTVVEGWENIGEEEFRKLTYFVWDQARQLSSSLIRSETNKG